MAAISVIAARDALVHELTKRKSWPAREPGVMTVFCIVGVGMFNLALSSGLTFVSSIAPSLT